MTSIECVSKWSRARCARTTKSHLLESGLVRGTRLAASVLLFAASAAGTSTFAAEGSACLGGSGSGDVDGNGFVDLADLVHLPSCLSGPGGGTFEPICKCFDTDIDGDADLFDAAAVILLVEQRPGCTIDGVFYEPGAVGAFPDNCGVCDPERSTTSWSFVAAGSVCNAGSGDSCDKDEKCSGSSFKCPADSFASNATVCRVGSNDSCDPSEFCPGVPDVKCPNNIVAPAGTECRAAAGPCDAAEQCTGVSGAKCPLDAKQPTDHVCRAAGSDCDPAETCSGVSNDCPADTGSSNCDVGDPCSADEQCLSASCVIGVCGEGDGGFGAACDSAADCYSGYLCFDGICFGSWSSYCTRSDQCGNQLACDAEATGECRVGVGFSCSSDLECETNASCLGGVCKLNTNESCSTNDECGSGACVCPYRSCTPAPNITCSCVPQGVCKVLTGGVCHERGDCQDQIRFDPRLAAGYERTRPGTCNCPTERYCDDEQGLPCETNAQGMRFCPGGVVCLPPECSGPGTCELGPLVLGAICEMDPAPGTAMDPPQLGDSPNDGLCASGLCFKRAGSETGPCTPARVCSPTTTGGRGPGGYCRENEECPGGTCLNPCGNFLNPPNYFCCRDLNGVCSSDADCCGGFLQAARGCGSGGRCRVLAIEDEPCVTTSDCLRFGQSGGLECIADQFGSKFCTYPGDTPGLDAGAPCDPNEPNGFCAAGLQCYDCEQSGLGHICADATLPCCNNGNYDGWCPFSSVLTDNVIQLVNGLCCDYGCVSSTVPQHCGACNNNCLDERGNACVVEDSGVCAWTGDDLECRWTDDTTLCPDNNPDDEFAVRCEPTDFDTYACQSYVPIVQAVGWQTFCIAGPASGRECTTDSQCQDCANDCTCNRPSLFSQIFGGTGRCECP